MKRERKGGKGRRGGKEFMDAALDGYVRYVALRLWRAYDAARAEQPEAGPQTLLDALGAFAARGEYADLWRDRWAEHALGAAARAGGPEDVGTLFAGIEDAVRHAVGEERALRVERGQPPLEDLPDYNAFIRGALGKLFQEASGEHENL